VNPKAARVLALLGGIAPLLWGVCSIGEPTTLSRLLLRLEVAKGACGSGGEEEEEEEEEEDGLR
jgi:hypothetical protein